MALASFEQPQFHIYPIIYYWLGKLNLPPAVGIGTPVVEGKLNGRLRNTLSARNAKHSASMASPRHPISSELMVTTLA